MSCALMSNCAVASQQQQVTYDIAKSRLVDISLRKQGSVRVTCNGGEGVYSS